MAKQLDLEQKHSYVSLREIERLNFMRTLMHALIFWLKKCQETRIGHFWVYNKLLKCLPFPLQVHSWLEQLFHGEGGVPEYEINSQTIEQLYQMALRCQARERSAKVIIEDLEQKAEEYAAESK